MLASKAMAIVMLLVAVVFGVFLIVLIGLPGMCVGQEHTFLYPLSILIIALLLVNSYLFFKKIPTSSSRFSLYSILVFSFLFLLILGSLSSDRCISERFRVNTELKNYQLALQQYHTDKDSYPLSLGALSPQYIAPTGYTRQFQYAIANNSYQLCALHVGRGLFYDVPITAGESICVGPDPLSSSH